MLREILNELFRPPYDIIQILMITLIVLLGLYTCSMIIWSFRCHSEKQKIRRFFSAHKSTTGVIIKYDAADGDKYITVSSAVPGQAVPFVPHVHEIYSYFRMSYRRCAFLCGVSNTSERL